MKIGDLVRFRKGADWGFILEDNRPIGICISTSRVKNRTEVLIVWGRQNWTPTWWRIEDLEIINEN